MPRLIQLKNGEWIAPAHVALVRVPDESSGSAYGGPYLPRVVVHYHGCDKLLSIVEYPTFDAARAARDELAAMINAAADTDDDGLTWAPPADTMFELRDRAIDDHLAGLTEEFTEMGD